MTLVWRALQQQICICSLSECSISILSLFLCWTKYTIGRA